MVDSLENFPNDHSTQCIVGAMTVAKLIHEKDKVMQGGVAVAEEGVLQQ